MRVSYLGLAFLLAGCTDNSGTDDTGSDAPQPGEFEFYINDDTIGMAPTGNLGCYDVGGAWLTQAVDPAKQQTATITEIVEDFEFDVAINDATVDVWVDDLVDGAPDHTQAANESGQVTFDLPVCTPIAYRATVPPGLDTHKATYESHQIFEPADSSPAPSPYNIVAKSTYGVILNLLGVTPDPAYGVVAGTLYDCDKNPIEGAQIVVVDDEGNIPPESLTKYFIDDFPARDQLYTSADGLWTAINLPPGDWTVQAWVWDGADGHVQVGSTRLQIFPDSINISNIYYGFDGGIWYPPSCLAN